MLTVSMSTHRKACSTFKKKIRAKSRTISKLELALQQLTDVYLSAKYLNDEATATKEQAWKPLVSDDEWE